MKNIDELYSHIHILIENSKNFNINVHNNILKDEIKISIESNIYRLHKKEYDLLVDRFFNITFGFIKDIKNKKDISFNVEVKEHKIVDINTIIFDNLEYLVKNDTNESLTMKLYMENLYNIHCNVSLGIIKLNNTESIYDDRYMVLIGNTFHNIITYSQLLKSLKFYFGTKILEIDENVIKTIIPKTHVLYLPLSHKYFYQYIQNQIREEYRDIGDISLLNPQNKIGNIYVFQSHIDPTKFIPCILYQYIDVNNKLRKIHTLIGLCDMNIDDIVDYCNMNDLYNTLKINKIIKLYRF